MDSDKQLSFTPSSLATLIVGTVHCALYYSAVLGIGGIICGYTYIPIFVRRTFLCPLKLRGWMLRRVFSCVRCFRVFLERYIRILSNYLPLDSAAISILLPFVIMMEHSENIFFSHFFSMNSGKIFGNQFP